MTQSSALSDEVGAEFENNNDNDLTPSVSLNSRRGRILFEQGGRGPIRILLEEWSTVDDQGQESITWK